MKKMFRTSKYGELFLDRVLFESYYPILFTCTNEQKELFLCLCAKADGDIVQWLFTKVHGSTIIKMLRDKMTIRDTFLYDKVNKYSVILKNGEYTESENDLTIWDKENSSLLPTTNEYMEAEDGEFDEEIEYFKNWGLTSKLDSDWVKFCETTIQLDGKKLVESSEMYKVSLDFVQKTKGWALSEEFETEILVIDKNIKYTTDINYSECA